MNRPPFIRRFTIKARMLALIGTVMLMLTAVGCAGVYGMHRVNVISEEYLDRSVEAATDVSELRAKMTKLRRIEKDMIINYENTAEVGRGKKVWIELRDELLKSIDSMKATSADDKAKVLLAMRGKVDAYSAAFLPIVGQIEGAAYERPALIIRIMRQANDAADAAEVFIADLAKLQSLDVETGKARLHTAIRKALTGFGGVLLLAAAVVIPLTLLNMRSICVPMNQARELADRIASGDLSGTIKVEGKDETAAMMRALADMQSWLQTIVHQVRLSIQDISIASSEIASGNQDLSARTERAAANVQGAASTIMQLTDTVRLSAESAQNANDLATKTAHVANRGGTLVANVVSTMGEINTSSNRVQEIVGVIDSIAFQTNILALNAAVEAARAGEQGRGFAVVAGEVRNLAQRSAKAASEIKGLISDSMGRVLTGTKLVNEAGATMKEVVQSVMNVSTLIGEISKTSFEQAGDVQQVSTSVTDLDQMTQQNSALVEQSAAAAESLKDQARRLSDLVGTFKLAQISAAV